MPGKFFLTLMVVFTTSVTVVADDEAAGAKLHQYFAAFNEKDVDRIATSIYSTPVQIGAASGHRIYADPQDAIDCMSKSKRRAGLNLALQILKYVLHRQRWHWSILVIPELAATVNRFRQR